MRFACCSNLNLHATCRFVRVTFMSEKWIAPGGLQPPFAEGRPVGSALYFMVTPVAPVRLHRIRNAFGAGFWAQAPNGPAWSQPTWKLAMSTHCPKNIRT